MTDAEIAQRYLELSNTGETEAAEGLEHAEIRFWLSGRLIVSGDMSAAQHRKASAGVHDTFPAGYRLQIKSVTASGGRVAIEAKGEGILADGTPYTPDYAFFFEIHEGLIASLHEYIDTEYVGATFKLPVRV